MTTHRQITDLWADFQDVIANVDALATSADGHAPENALHDYSTRSTPWRLANLVGRETANERQHRGVTTVPGFSVGDAAKLHIMSNALYGATFPEMPPAHLFLTMRATAAEAMVIGYLVRAELTPEWMQRVEKLDYSELMKGAA